MMRTMHGMVCAAERAYPPWKCSPAASAARGAISSRFLISMVCLFGLALMPQRSDGAVKVLFLGYDVNVQNTMNDILGSNGTDSRFDYANSSYLQFQNPGTVGLATLQQYDSVLVWSNSAPDATTGDNLAAYVDGGGGVVLATFSGYYDYLNSAWANSGINASGYNPLTGYSNPNGSNSLGSYDTLHPIMNGVTSLASSHYNSDYSGVDSGATLIASWSNGEPLAAINSAGNVATITLFPNVATYGHASGDYRVLFRNALAYVGEDQMATVPEPVSITIWGGLALGGLLVSRRRKRLAASS